MDRHDPVAAIRHDYPGSGLRDSHGLDGGVPADRRPPAGRQADLRSARRDQPVPAPRTKRSNAGDIVVFRYPIDLNQTFVKRVVGVPGDRLRLVDKQLWVNGRPAQEPYAIFKSDYIDNYRDNFPVAPTSMQVYEPAVRMLREHVVDGELVVS